MNAPTIIIADDHPLLLRGLKDFLIHKNYHLIDIADNGNAAYSSIIKNKPDIAILDIEMPGMTGLEIAQKCKQHQAATRIVLITLHRERELYLQARELNIFGYLLKEFALEEIENCLTSVSRGTPYFSPKISGTLNTSNTGNDFLYTLTPSERKILKLIAANKTTPEIAEMLFISSRTVDKHRSNIIQKLGLNTKTNSLLVWAMDHKDLL